MATMTNRPRRGDGLVHALLLVGAITLATGATLGAVRTWEDWQATRAVQAAAAQARCRAELRCWADRHHRTADLACIRAAQARGVTLHLQPVVTFTHYRWAVPADGSVTYLTDGWWDGRLVQVACTWQPGAGVLALSGAAR